MSFSIREGKVDLAILASPHVEIWPSIGVRTISLLCSEMGLTVGQYGGESLIVRGVIPLPSTGGIVFVEDIQKRIHRILARTVIRISPEEQIPNPFLGWRSSGLIPISTAEKLKKEGQVSWGPTTVILGTGNRALRFGSALLESGAFEVFCVESYTQWNAKRFAGWEVEKRRFEMLGGKVIEAKPIQLQAISPLKWQLRLQDSLGIRILEVGRVISAGPFQETVGIKEYPAGSSLYEFQQTAQLTYVDDLEGWSLEEERGKWLALKVIKTLISNSSHKKEELEQIFRKTKGRLKHSFRHREEPFTPNYQGKWITANDSLKLRAFSGVPKSGRFKSGIASIECFEEISCQICQKICPTNAIQTGSLARSQNNILKEDACTSCGLCVAACPTGSIPLLFESEEKSFSALTLAWRGSKPWSVGEFTTLLNRRGESLGSARISALPQSTNPNIQLLQLEVPTHLLWEARGVKRMRTPSAEDESFLTATTRSEVHVEKVEVTVNGEKRLVRDKIWTSIALFEIGQNRPEDALLCLDGSCGLCLIQVDGIKKLACQTRIHKGMAIRIPIKEKTEQSTTQPLCPCLGINESTVVARINQGKLQSPEAVLSVTQVGEGKCHGQLCMGAFKRILKEQGLPVSHWIDWRYPWSDWILPHN